MTPVVSPLDLRYMGGDKWLLIADFVYVSEIIGRIKVPAGFITDFNSIPRGLWNILPPGQYAEAGVVHDWLYDTGEHDRGTCDRVHREILEWLRAPRWKRRLMYAGLRSGGWWAWRKHRNADKPKETV